MKPRISMITLGVADLKKSIHFYKDGLGFPLQEATESVAFFDLNGSWLGLYGKEALAEDAGVPAQGSGFNGFSLSHNLDSEDEVNMVFNEAIAAGAEPVKQPQKVFWGGFSGYFKDPDGYLWEIAHNPHTWIGPKDE